MSNPQISLIIPTHNSEKYLEQVIESARDQSCELIGNSGRNLIRKLDRDITLLAELEDPACQEGNDDRAEHAGCAGPVTCECSCAVRSFTRSIRCYDEERSE